MRKSLFWIVSLVWVPTMLTPGCATVKRFGDAAVYDRLDFPFVSYDELRLPKIKLDKPRLYDFKVRNLPFVGYPQQLRMGVRRDELELARSGGPPWQDCEVKIELRSVNGEIFFSNTVYMAEIKADKGVPGLELDFRVMRTQVHESLPRHTSYDVHVEVLRPSKNPFHRAYLFNNMVKIPDRKAEH